MTPVAYPRRVATLLLRFVIWIAPHDTLDWGHAMLGELNHVRGNWAALIWAIGGAGVLAKHAALAAILPDSHRRTISSAEELFAKEGPMRKTTLSASVTCAAASLLFFLAPVFRQAFHVSLAQWHDVLHIRLTLGCQESDPELEALARKAEQNHDAEGLAFAAIRHWNESESARLADKAVHLDPKLTWIYAVIAVQYSSPSEIDRWVPELEQWDSQNALPHFIVAEKIDIDQIVREKIPHRLEDQPPAWQDAMAAAFQSPKIDNYLGRLKELDRRVLLRYHVDDPFQILGIDRWYGLPSYTAWDTSRYAKSLLESGQALEARGNRKGAFEKYWTVARFGQMIGPSGGFFVRRELQEAYKRLGALSEKEGNKIEAAFYSSLANQTDIAQQEERIALSKRFNGSDVSHWNAFLVRLSGVMILFSGGLLTICAFAVIVRGRFLRLSSLRPSRLTLALGFGAGIGALISSAMLYISYRPYTEILRRFILKGDEAGLSELSNFLATTQVPLGAQGFIHVWEFVFYFWFGVVLLCIFALLVAVLLRFQHRTRANPAI
ncbi:MAG: hypothetical protein JWN63_2185 [Candidatus Acidoferrum typicum]|nr:hypothetical protein [Candidatus Acidoferrum typicum]